MIVCRRAPARSEQLTVDHGDDFYLVYRARRIDACFHSAAHDAANLTTGTTRSAFEDLPRLCAGRKPFTVLADATELALAAAMLTDGMELRRGAKNRFQKDCVGGVHLVVGSDNPDVGGV